MLPEARSFGAEAVATVFVESNVDGLGFDVARGFVEVGRYLSDDDPLPFLTSAPVRLFARRPGLAVVDSTRPSSVRRRNASSLHVHRPRLPLEGYDACIAKL
jgi:hypothetical protein